MNIIISINNMFKPTPLEYYRQFRSINQPADTSFFTSKIDNLITDLATCGVKFYYIKWSEKIVEEGPEFEYEYFCEDMSEELEESNAYMYVSERHVFWASVEPPSHHRNACSAPINAIEIQHCISEEHRDSVNEILFKHFPGRTLGYEHDSTTIDIQIEIPEQLIPQEPILMIEVRLYYDETHHYEEEELKNMFDPRINIQFACSHTDYQGIFLEVASSLIPDLVLNIRNIDYNNTHISHFEIYDYSDDVNLIDISKL